MTTTLNRNIGIKLTKDIIEGYKINQGSKLFSVKGDEYRKHGRIKTEAYEETINDKISQIYSKFNNNGMGISLTRDNRQEKPEKQEKVEKASQEPDKNYKIQETAGKGTFGVVYKATSLITGEPVAIKKVLQDKRYKNRELQIMKMLHHPNLLEIKDHYYTKQGGEEYLNVVMDYFEENLYNYNRSYTKKGDNIPPILIKIYSYQLFKAINYLTALSIAHRDIKPHNILIDPNNNKLVICDFGSAKQLVPSTFPPTQTKPISPTSVHDATEPPNSYSGPQTTPHKSTSGPSAASSSRWSTATHPSSATPRSTSSSKSSKSSAPRPKSPP